MSQSYIEAHVDLIAKHEQDSLAKRTPSEKLGDRIGGFASSFAFVGLQLGLFAFWMVWNQLPGPNHFDPYPYSLLGTVGAMEAIILASFILMRQARMGRRADERDHLMLQILLLSEKGLLRSSGWIARSQRK